MVDPEQKPIATTTTTTVQQPSVAPTTTVQQDLVSAGQRRVNILWEVTQAAIAIIVTCGTMYVAAVLVLQGSATAATAFLLLSNAFFMIVTSYFQRTNHTRTGGVAPSEEKRRGE